MERIETVTEETHTLRFPEPDEELREGSFGYVVYPDGEIFECVGEEAQYLPNWEEPYEPVDDHYPF